MYHPGATVNYNDFEQLFAQLPSPFLVMGDFNGHHPILGSRSTNPMGRILERLAVSNEICLLNDGSGTRLNINTGETSCPDITACSPDISTRLDWHVADEKFGSDHFVIVVKDTLPVSITPVKRFAIARAKWEKFEQLSIIPECEVNDVEGMLNIFETTLNNAALESIPHTVNVAGRIPVPWWDDECKRTRREKKQAQRRYHRSPTVDNKIALNRARAAARCWQRRARRRCWLEYVSKLKSTTSMSTVHKMMRKMQGKHARPPIPTLTINNETILESSQVANRFAQHFADISSSNSYTPEFNTRREAEESIPIDFGSADTPYNDQITLSEIRAALQDAKNTACGEDGVYYQMLRSLSEATLTYMQSIFNKCWIQGTFPRRWSEATLLPFTKPGKPTTELNSYRPIALTSCICKILEKIVNVRLNYFLESNELLNKLQYGFRKMRGTEDVLARLETAICSAFAHRKSLYGVFFDIYKAYDTAWKYGILRALFSYGIRGHLGKFI